MSFTDIFIRRPVLASVISLLILVVGVRAYYSLPVLQYPRTENAVVTVTTTYYGADPDVVAGFITTPLEIAIAQAYGIDYMTSTSQSSTSTITIYLRLNYDADKALTEINTKIASVLNQLPTGTQQPVLTVKIGQTIDAMYLGFDSDTLAPNQITDYLTRVVQPKLQTIPGVQTAELLGQKVFALRAWLDPQKLAAYGLTATDVSQALAANDFISGIGNTKGQMVQVNLTASTGLHTVERIPQSGDQAGQRRRRPPPGRGQCQPRRPRTMNPRSASTASRRSISACRWRRRRTSWKSSAACTRSGPTSTSNCRAGSTAPSSTTPPNS